MSIFAVESSSGSIKRFQFFPSGYFPYTVPNFGYSGVPVYFSQNFLKLFRSTTMIHGESDVLMSVFNWFSFFYVWGSK